MLGMANTSWGKVSVRVQPGPLLWFYLEVVNEFGIEVAFEFIPIPNIVYCMFIDYMLNLY